MALLEQHLQIVDPELGAIESLDNSIDSLIVIESKPVAIGSKPLV